ncbi:M56 family metallopeptidase [Aquimarina sp. SS2-1]|uniref:M56 family metallopeptidase n=1 Tax=Aquimarina besae TaxID=3342247 RepID=UPI00366A7A3C
MEAFLIYLLKSSVTLSIFYLVYLFCLRKETFFTLNRHFLLAGIICSLLLPFLEFTTVEFVEKPVFKSINFTSTTSSNLEAESAFVNWWLIVFILYIFIAILLFGRFIFQLISLKRIITKSKNKQKGGFSILKTKEDIAPFSFFRYIIFNPLLHHTEELKMILKHEKIHAKQYHTIDILITNLFVIFQWINPISWLYKKSLQQNLEFIADHEAIRNLPSKKEYQLALIKVSSNNFSSITNNFYQSLIKKRIVMLNKKESNHQNLWKATIILPLLSLFLWGFNTKTEIHYIQNETPELNILPNIQQQREMLHDSEENMFPVKEKKPVNRTTPLFPKKNESQNSNDLRNTFPKNTVLKNKTKNSIPTNKQQPATPEVLTSQKNTIEFVIDKTFTNDDLERIKRIFKNEYEVEISFSDIKRNDANEIIGISLVMSSEKSNANYSIADHTPILPFVLSYDNKKDKIKIGQYFTHNDIKNGSTSSFYIEKEDENNGIIKINSFTKNNEHTTLKYDSANKKVIAIDKNGNEKELKPNVVYNDSDNNIFIQNHGNGMIYDFDNNSEKKPLFFIDGKKASKKEVKKLKSSDIDSIDVSKGEASIKKYGKKAKDGVINITTKKNSNEGTGFSFKNDPKSYSIVNSNNDKKVKIKVSDGMNFTSGASKPKPLVYINGKKADYSKLQKIESDQIASVNIYKDLKALTKFGSEAENGVIEVILKN